MAVSKVIVSTGNITTAGPQVLRRPTVEKSNVELLNSLRANFKSSIVEAEEEANGDAQPKSPLKPASKCDKSWAELEDSGILWVPALDEDPTGLLDSLEQYDITGEFHGQRK